ncbi:uncharacterized protein LOC124449357 [Xenia sp. Carnegie-2017]|uniref:uncharacterized protein LOC124449357 n=1 Tax=Xenia sp. Carnegie-2017 TaxID=2897299 RepID=UPI001F03613F|nr:uncharacterized protein LOC124449357 [Xenia sp. Carnegie-2017]
MCMEKHAPVMCMPQKARIQTNYLAFENPGIGRFLLVLPLEGIFFMLIILFIDFNAIRSLRSSIRSVYVDPFDSSHPNGDTEDSDVMAEKRPVLNDEVNEDVVVVKDLTKIFKVPGREFLLAVFVDVLKNILLLSAETMSKKISFFNTIFWKVTKDGRDEFIVLD